MKEKQNIVFRSFHAALKRVKVDQNELENLDTNELYMLMGIKPSNYRNTDRLFHTTQVFSTKQEQGVSG